MGGDLSLTMLLEASATGLLRTLQVDPYDRHDMLQLRYAIQQIRRERYLRYSQREWVTSLVTQVCMAIGNRDRYRTANEDMMRLLSYLRDLDLPDSDRKNETSNAYDDITTLWRHVFGDPEEFERKQMEQNTALGLVESDNVRQQQEREKYIRKNLFQGR